MNVWQGNARHIRISEVGMRDGIQSESAFVPTEQKIALVNMLSQTDASKIKITSLVSPKAVPTLGDVAEVMADISRSPDVIYTDGHVGHFTGYGCVHRRSGSEPGR